LKAGEPERALSEVRQAIPYLPTMLRGQDDERGALSRVRHASLFTVGAAAAAALDRPTEVAYFLENGRAGALLETLGDRETLQAAVIPEELRLAEAQARAAEVAAYSAHAKAVERGELPDIRAKRDALDAARTRLEDVVARVQRSAKASVDVLYPRAATLEEMQGWLEARDALLVYGLLGERAIALVVTRSDAKVVDLGLAKAVDEACTAFSAAPDADGAAASLEALRRMLVEPLKLSPPTRRLLVAPEGSLAYVPFAALAPDRDVAFVPSGTTYGVLREATVKPGTGVLALGDPDYGSVELPPRLAMRGGAKLVPLPATREEVTAIGDVLLLGKDASEADLRAALGKRPRWRSVHLACHGFFDPDHPGRSHLAVAPSAEDDGVLRAAEIVRARVPADLVVLSACETGKGKDVRGEGLVGLTRAFMFAGAPRVVCSLWKVDDAATSALMTKFYALWNPKDGSKPLETAAALRAAQEHVRTREVEVPDEDAFKREGRRVTRRVRPWEHPRFWAAWVLWGLPD